jgi:hypothetical protein
MVLNDIHSVLINANVLYLTALGVWSAVFAGRNQQLSGNFWGAVFTYAGLAAVTLVIGVIMALNGLRPQRPGIYFLYMAWLVVIMPGLFSMMRGRDDRGAALTFSLLAFFNAAVVVSMVDRMVTGPWV